MQPPASAKFDSVWTRKHRPFSIADIGMCPQFSHQGALAGRWRGSSWGFVTIFYRLRLAESHFFDVFAIHTGSSPLNKAVVASLGVQKRFSRQRTGILQRRQLQLPRLESWNPSAVAETRSDPGGDSSESRCRPWRKFARSYSGAPSPASPARVHELALPEENEYLRWVGVVRRIDAKLNVNLMNSASWFAWSRAWCGALPNNKERAILSRAVLQRRATELSGLNAIMWCFSCA